MDNMEAQIGSILENPEMMQKIMSMAQALSASAPKETQEPPNHQPPPKQESPKQEAPAFSMPDIDLGMIQKLSGFARQSNVDSNQRSLLKALGPYLSRDRIGKLERAMRAAKMASMASVFLGKQQGR